MIKLVYVEVLQISGILKSRHQVYLLLHFFITTNNHLIIKLREFMIIKAYHNLLLSFIIISISKKRHLVINFEPKFQQIK